MSYLTYIYHNFRGYFFSHFSKATERELERGPYPVLVLQKPYPLDLLCPQGSPRDLSIAQERGRERPRRCEGQCPQHVRARRSACCFTGHVLESTYIHTYTHTHIDIYNHIYIYGSDGANMQDVDLTNNNTDYINIILKIGMYQILRPTLGIQL